MTALAPDLPGLLAAYGTQMAERVHAALPPVCTAPDAALREALATLEQRRSQQTGTTFRFFPSQVEQIAGHVAGLAAHRGTKFIAGMGSGKTSCSVAVAHVLFRRRPAYRVLVMVPPHLVLKWKREIEWLVPGVHAAIITSLPDLRAFVRTARTRGGPAFAVLSRETAKLGYELGAPCAAAKRLPSGTDEEFIAAACPDCGAVLTHADDTPWERAAYIAQDHAARCPDCGRTAATGRRRASLAVSHKPHLDRYIQRKLKRFFSLLIADESHELAGTDTLQGNAFGTLAAACGRTLDLTGTLIGGLATDLHAHLWRMAPDLMLKRGFTISGFKHSRVSAIARNATTFARLYGVIETKELRSEGDDFSGRVWRWRLGRKKDFRKTERIRPGIAPDLFNHFLPGRATFMTIDELGPELPPLQRILVPCAMSDTLRDAYRDLDNELTSAIKDHCHGKAPPSLAATRVITLDAYADRPWGWSPISVPIYDRESACTGMEVVATPQDLGENHRDGKDTELVRICKQEHREGRRCAVYVQFTDKHDVRGKLAALLTAAGLKVACLPDSVRPLVRERWLDTHGAKADVLIVHPKRVMTGLDLIMFPSLIWYQVGYSTHVLRQASARARRPAQTKPCRVYYLYYENSIQSQALALMGDKEKASLMLEGTFDLSGLNALMNGGADDDILGALSRSVSTARDPHAAWNLLTPPAACADTPLTAADLFADCPLFALTEEE